MIAGLSARGALIRALGVLLLLTVAMRYFPLPSYWSFAFDVLQLHRLWPLLILLAGIHFTRAGVRHHRKDGLPQFFPFLGSVVALSFLALIALLLIDTAADWPFEWCIAASVPIAAAIGAAIPGHVAFTECWRSRHNDSVIRRVQGTLSTGRFDTSTRRRIAAKDWGSRQCLRIVESNYAVAKREVLCSMLEGTDPENFEAMVDAGKSMALYLDLRWPAQVMDSSEQRSRKRELIRELATVCLISDRGRRRFVTEINGWIRFMERDEDPYPQLLASIFRLGQSGGRCESAAQAGVIIKKTMRLFEATPARTPLDPRPICADTWLALAHRSLPKQACFDVWMAMSAQLKKDPFLPAAGESVLTPSGIGAHNFLVCWYSEWRDMTDAGWNETLAGRAAFVQQLIAREQLLTHGARIHRA